MSVHTPGPWGWTYDGSKDYSIGPAEDPQVDPVAHVYAWHRNYDRAAANCALIAAAPDLLAACKAAQRALNIGDVDALPLVDAAIARATNHNNS